MNKNENHTANTENDMQIERTLTEDQNQNTAPYELE